MDLFRLRLPRIYMIVEEINRRLCADLWARYPGDWDRISRMSIIAYNQVRMANLCVAAYSYGERRFRVAQRNFDAYHLSRLL